MKIALKFVVLLLVKNLLKKMKISCCKETGKEGSIINVSTLLLGANNSQDAFLQDIDNSIKFRIRIKMNFQKILLGFKFT